MTPSPIKYCALNITHNCNLRCKYCYAGEKIDRSMDYETACAAVDFLACQSEEKVVITFFGGEPLLEYDLMKKIVSYSREKYRARIEFRMSTNGTLLSPKIIEFCKENNLFFVLSIDGNEMLHNTCRRYDSGKGTYRDIERHFDEVFKFNPYTMAVSVITPESAVNLSDGVRDLVKKGFRYILQTLDYSAQWTSKDVKILKKQYLRLAKFYAQRLAEGDKIVYTPFDERIRTWAEKPYEKGDLCDLANTQVAVAPSGRIYPCVQFIGIDDEHSRVNSIGDVFEGFDQERRSYFIEKNYEDRVSCVGCALYGRCATYCGCVNWRATGDLATIPPIICEHERMLMPIVDSMANRLWKKNVPLFRRKFYEKTFPVSSYIEDCLFKGSVKHAQN